jgi:signal transduction histidine kinase
VEGQASRPAVFEAELLARIDWLISLRWFAVLALAGVWGLGWSFYRDQLAALPLAAIILALAVYNAEAFLYARNLRLARSADPAPADPRFLALQLIMDTIALALLVHFSGGVENPLAWFLLLPVAIAGSLSSRGIAFGIAALAGSLFVAIAGLEYAEVVAHYHLPLLGEAELYQRLPFVLAHAGMLTAGLAAMAYLTSAIGVSLRGRARALMTDFSSTLDESRELAAINERLRQMDAERTRFMTLVAHELRAPLNTIHTCVELAMSEYASPEKVHDTLERVHSRTAELSELISDLLRLARAREEAVRDEALVVVQAADVLQNVVQLMRTEADSKDLFLSVQIDPHLAPVRANPDRLKLVWTNLLSNAIKYTEPGGIVAVALSQTPKHLVGTVRDTGIGIAMEDRDRIFEEFYRAENARGMHRVGTGMGLSIVRRIIEGWGGTLTVESELGMGSKFTFALPRVGRNTGDRV